MTDGSLREFVAEREMAAALRVVYETAEAGDGTVRWADVHEEIDGEQWGRLLGEGVLLPVGNRFVIDDPTAVRTVLAERDGIDLDSSEDAASTENTEDTGGATDGTAIGREETDGTGWTTADKLAGIVALTLVGGYQLPMVRDAIAGTVDLVLGPTVGTMPFPALLFGLAAAVAITSTGVRRRLGGGAMDEVQERTQSLREDLRAARKRKDEATIERLENEQREVITEQLGAMKYQFRPLVWTMLLTIPVFMWLTWLTVDPTGAIASASTFIPVLGEIVWTARVLGPVQAWIVWYGLCSLLASLATRRTLDRLGVGAGA
jgi:uncharacterized membrane protein (DUF106 family)